MSGLGEFAPLADPVTDASGNLFLGSTDGHLFALHADGSPFWDRELPSHDTILTSPAVASDGSVFVVGGYKAGVRNHRNDSSGDSWSTYHLYRFLPGGYPDAITSIPVINKRLPMAPASIGRPATWHSGSDEVVIVTALYPTRGGTDLHVFAFSLNGGLLADWMVHQSSGAVTEGGGLLDFLFPGFTPGEYAAIGNPALPGVSITELDGAEPYIVLVDRINRALIGLAYVAGPTPHFEVRWQTGHGGYKLLSPPAMLRDWHSAVGIKSGVLFGGPSASQRPDLTFISTQDDGYEDIYAAPIPAADGRTIAVTAGGEVIGFTDAVLSRVDLGSSTIAPAATSKTHVFVATHAGLHTLDATGSAVEASYAWSKGGVWAPAVGPQGHVYAMADHTLHVFAPPAGPRVPRDMVRDHLDVNPR